MSAKRAIFVKEQSMSIHIVFVSNIILGHYLNLFYTEFSYMQDKDDNDSVGHIIIAPLG